MKKAFTLLGFVLLSCGQAATDDDRDRDATIDAPIDASPGTCTPCEQSSDCRSGAACVQYAGSDYCGTLCDDQHACTAGETCAATATEDGTKVSVCVPSTGTCGENGCETCPAGSQCDLIAGNCVEPEPDGGIEDDGGPEVDAGTEIDAGSDAGAIKPHVGPDGGKVSKLFFAVVGDTRPPAPNDTDHYPSAIITKIYQDMEAMSPRPEFVVATGDYMFASPDGLQGPKQMKLYLAARDHFSGVVFGTLGNHECGGGNDNCAGATNNHNFNAFLDGIIKPLGKTKPYYSIPISDLNGKWTAKIVNAACNAWSATQKTWLINALAKPTTYTFVVRHQPLGSSAPCTADMNEILKTAKYNLLLVGHVHQYLHSGKQLVDGCGGAPLTGTANYGYATVSQLAGGGFRVRQYDYKTKQVVGSFTVP